MENSSMMSLEVLQNSFNFQHSKNVLKLSISLGFYFIVEAYNSNPQSLNGMTMKK